MIGPKINVDFIFWFNDKVKNPSLISLFSDILGIIQGVNKSFTVFKLDFERIFKRIFEL